MNHLPALKPVFTDLHSGVNLIFEAYRIYINHWGTLRLIDGTRAPTSAPAATTAADATRAVNLPDNRSHPPNARPHTARDLSSGSSTWRSTTARIGREATRTPSQVFMAEVDAPTSGNNGRVDNPGTRQDIPTTGRAAGPSNTSQMVVQLGEPGTIPMKVPAGQGPSNQTSSQQPRQPPGQGSQPSCNRKQA